VIRRADVEHHANHHCGPAPRIVVARIAMASTPARYPIGAAELGDKDAAVTSLWLFKTDLKPTWMEELCLRN
jgi:hypothetical protein